MASSETDPRLLRLAPKDNVLVSISEIKDGERLNVEGTSVRAAKTVFLGHKVAAREIAAGEKIFKYGAPIGSAACRISVGEHVHTHNMKSDYLPTYVREGKESYVRAH